jgi:4-amino-4-deoxy-L-arabinose transferase-like glycosyltransferase
MPSRSFDLFFYACLVVLAVIYCIAMQLPIMDIDSSQYALISKEMFETGSYLQIYDKGADYLDKPPLVFWAACLSFKIFGVHDWSFRLPSVLCLALGIYSTYRFTRLFYGELTGKIAALVMASCFATYVMCDDLRIDTMLTGWVMFSLWQLAEFNATLKLKNIILGAIGVGLAMITKGPIGLIIPVTAFSVHFIYMRQWKSFFRWQYLLALLVIAIILIPMSYGLYEQFDVTHSKKVDGKVVQSGLMFYYWTQSFGRITGQSGWNNSPDPFFLLHSFLWSFLPWTVFFIVALFTEIKTKIKEYKSPARTEAITVVGFVLILLFLTRSHYQLPHYTFAIHPLAAVITAKYLSSFLSTPQTKNKLFSVTYGVNVFVIVVLYALCFLVLNYIFPVAFPYSILVAFSFGLLLSVLINKKAEAGYKAIVSTVLTFITLGFVLCLNFYPTLLSYQSGSQAALDLNKIAPDNSRLLIYKDYAVNSLIFYSKAPVTEYIDENSLPKNMVKDHTFIYADSVNAKAIMTDHPEIKPVKMYKNWAVTLLNGRFLNPATRNIAIDEKNVLMKY